MPVSSQQPAAPDCPTQPEWIAGTCVGAEAIAGVDPHATAFIGGISMSPNAVVRGLGNIPATLEESPFTLHPDWDAFLQESQNAITMLGNSRSQLFPSGGATANEQSEIGMLGSPGTSSMNSRLESQHLTSCSAWPPSSCSLYTEPVMLEHAQGALEGDNLALLVPPQPHAGIVREHYNVDETHAAAETTSVFFHTRLPDRSTVHGVRAASLCDRGEGNANIGKLDRAGLAHATKLINLGGCAKIQHRLEVWLVSLCHFHLIS